MRMAVTKATVVKKPKVFWTLTTVECILAMGSLRKLPLLFLQLAQLCRLPQSNNVVKQKDSWLDVDITNSRSANNNPFLFGRLAPHLLKPLSEVKNHKICTDWRKLARSFAALDIYFCAYLASAPPDLCTFREYGNQHFLPPFPLYAFYTK